MYVQRKIPDVFKHHFEAIHLLATVLYSKIQSQEITEDIDIFRCPHTMARAFQKLFPAFEVWDGVVSRFGKEMNRVEYGTKGYLHFESTGRVAIVGQFRPIVHSILGFKEIAQQVNGQIVRPSLAIDVLPLGGVAGMAFPVPICLDEQGLPFVRRPLLPTEALIKMKEKELAKNVRRILPLLKEISTENAEQI
jgi:hypothetical protein